MRTAQITKNLQNKFFYKRPTTKTTVSTNILIIAEKKKQVQSYLDALKNKNQDYKYLRISKITLVSKDKKTEIKTLGETLPEYDAVFIQARTSLAPFIEPLLEELQNLNTFISVKKGSYYIGANEPYQFVTLALAEVPTPKTITTASTKNISKVAEKISYPIIVKTFLGKKVQQSLVIHTKTELNGFVRSIKTEVDAFMIREFIESDVISCAVIGHKVIAVKRKYADEEITDIHAGQTYRLSETDHATVLHAAKANGYEIARVDLAKGRVVKIDPIIPVEEFNTASADNIEEYVADFLIEKALQHEKKAKIPFDFFGLRKIIEKTPIGGLLK